MDYFFWIAASLAAIVAANDNKTLLPRGVSILFINGKSAAINGLEKFKNPSFWLVIFLVVTFNKSLYFLKALLLFKYISLNCLLELFLFQYIYIFLDQVKTF